MIRTALRLRHAAPVCCLLCLALLSASCSVSDAVSIARVASGDTAAAVDLARNKAIRYATNPSAIEADFKRFKGLVASFRRAVGGTWGARDVREPEPKRYVKYTQNYLSRASVDFERGTILVETLDQDTPHASLRAAIATTLLTPYDPRAVDLYSAGPVTLGGKPFLLGEVKDAHGRDIATEAQADEFARQLVQTAVKQRPADPSLGQPGKSVSFVVIPMASDHMQADAASRPRPSCSSRKTTSPTARRTCTCSARATSRAWATRSRASTASSPRTTAARARCSRPSTPTGAERSRPSTAGRPWPCSRPSSRATRRARRATTCARCSRPRSSSWACRREGVPFLSRQCAGSRALQPRAGPLAEAVRGPGPVSQSVLCPLGVVISRFLTRAVP